MADQYEHNKPSVEETGAAVETTDRGLFDFIGKKEEEKPTHAHEDRRFLSLRESSKVMRSGGGSNREDGQKIKKKQKKKGLNGKDQGENIWRVQGRSGKQRTRQFRLRNMRKQRRKRDF
ncbi:hypothetical protein HAX54_034325 [Datura stramonium]|uniref:Uncharacterized protein n=1 Tax=Datura stramonium TaxID=4076 RepID=A0ABS8SE16_DATST|nr:hypothetical protein [Datura stramonium]